MTTGASSRLLCLVALALAAPGLGACGGGDEPSPPGSPKNPLVAESTESAQRSNEAAGSGRDAAAEGTPGYQELVERQDAEPRSRFTPCNLVTKTQARAFMGVPIQEPLEAPQGPTCIYRTQKGDGFVSVTVQSLDLGRLKRQLQQRTAVDVSDRTGYCGQRGQPMLYVPLTAGRVLGVGGTVRGRQEVRGAGRAGVLELTAR